MENGFVGVSVGFAAGSSLYVKDGPPPGGGRQQKNATGPFSFAQEVMYGSGPRHTSFPFFPTGKDADGVMLFPVRGWDLFVFYEEIAGPFQMVSEPGTHPPENQPARFFVSWTGLILLRVSGGCMGCFRKWGLFFP